MSGTVSHSRVVTPQDVRQLGTILSVWAHPDDESYGAAGIMAAAVENGQRVVCLTATKGELGVQDESRWPAAKLGDIRATELQEALHILGVREHSWLGYRDGDCDKIAKDEAVAKIKAFVQKVQPDTVLTFGPDGLTGHPDHQAVSRWVDEAVKGSKITVYHVVQEATSYEEFLKEADRQFNIFFNIDQPPVYNESECDIAFYLTPEQFNKKKRALLAMLSQTEAMFKNTPPGFAESVLRCECFQRAGSDRALLKAQQKTYVTG